MKRLIGILILFLIPLMGYSQNKLFTNVTRPGISWDTIKVSGYIPHRVTISNDTTATDSLFIAVNYDVSAGHITYILPGESIVLNQSYAVILTSHTPVSKRIIIE